MNQSKLPVETFTQFFDKQLPRLSQLYNWPVGDKAKQALPGFQWHKESGNLAECIELKQHLTQAWGSADDNERASLARWVVSDWGGVRANQPSTFESHLHKVSNEEDRPLKGIASYSKILSVVDCTRYAIYDARVAACLNAVQLEIEGQLPIFFHYVPGRNKTIQGSKNSPGFVSAFSKQELVHSRGWHEIEKDATYTTYLQLLHALKSRFPESEIYHFEMALFSLAPDLCGWLMNPQIRDHL
jgi:hypothetical protein